MIAYIEGSEKVHEIIFSFTIPLDTPSLFRYYINQHILPGWLPVLVLTKINA